MVELIIDGLLAAQTVTAGQTGYGDGGFGDGGYGDSSDTTASTAIFNLTAGRVYPVELPKSVAFPAIHYRFVGGNSKATQDTFGTQKTRLEVNCWGSSYSDAVTLRNAVIATLAQYNSQGVFISYLQPQDLFDEDLLQYRAIAEFYVFSNFSPS